MWKMLTAHGDEASVSRSPCAMSQSAHWDLGRVGTFKPVLSPEALLGMSRLIATNA